VSKFERTNKRNDRQPISASGGITPNVLQLYLVADFENENFKLR